MIKDSGNRIQFDTGAVRDISLGKGRCDLLPLDVVATLLRDSVLINIYNYQELNDTEFLYEALKNFQDFYFESLEDMVLEVSKHFEEGALKYGEYNWQKGIPRQSYLDSGVRHYLKHKRGDRDERHDRAFVWNILCLIWTITHVKDEEEI